MSHLTSVTSKIDAIHQLEYILWIFISNAWRLRPTVFISMPVLRFEWLLTAQHDISAILFLRDNVAIYNWQTKYAHNTVYRLVTQLCTCMYAKPTEMTRTSVFRNRQSCLSLSRRQILKRLTARFLKGSRRREKVNRRLFSSCLVQYSAVKIAFLLTFRVWCFLYQLVGIHGLPRNCYLFHIRTYTCIFYIVICHNYMDYVCET